MTAFATFLSTFEWSATALISSFFFIEAHPITQVVDGWVIPQQCFGGT
jgi:hypothetical protein